MTDIAVRIENLSKRYRIGQRESYQALRDVLTNQLYAPFRRLSARPSRQRALHNKGAQPTTSDQWIWALNNISFDIGRGEVVGIIGRNGAGKSTLLKILSRITEPTKGQVEIHGRVGALLEVGTGFHPELTGRENVYLNGTILGMKKAEIDRKFDEIVAFAEIEKFIDTPVKHYSSGMYMRLAFAVAANLEPEILIVDEVLAVGDAAFQKKCLGKMGEVAKQGRTVLFVSHNMDAIHRLCSHCVLIGQGQVLEYGDSPSVIARYLSSSYSKAGPNDWIDLSQVPRIGTGKARFLAIQYTSLHAAAAFAPYTQGPLEFFLELESDAARFVDSLAVTMYNQYGTKLLNADTVFLDHGINLREGRNRVKLRIDKLYLNPGTYRVGLWLANSISGLSTRNAYDFIDTAFELEVVNLDPKGFRRVQDSPVTCDFTVSEVT